MKTDTRLTEWERSGMTEPELITEPKTNGHWTMKPSQRKALQASDDDGAALPHNTPLTRANVEQIYGVGVDIDEMAAVAASADAPAPVAADMRIRTNSELHLVPRSSFLKRGIMPSIECLHANIRARNAVCELKRSYKVAGVVLYDLIQAGVEPSLPAVAAQSDGDGDNDDDSITNASLVGVVAQMDVATVVRECPVLCTRCTTLTLGWPSIVQEPAPAAPPRARRSERQRRSSTRTASSSPTMETSPTGTSRGQPQRNRPRTMRPYR
eukprot:COSAG06_NODE_7097_length_2636_cov_218.560878_3_plen_268_part_00